MTTQSLESARFGMESDTLVLRAAHLGLVLPPTFLEDYGPAQTFLSLHSASSGRSHGIQIGIALREKQGA